MAHLKDEKHTLDQHRTEVLGFSMECKGVILARTEGRKDRAGLPKDSKMFDSTAAGFSNIFKVTTATGC